ncbi:MAG: hypothetical protein U0838_02025 [Chloroflexota bacterium]
MAAKDRDLGAHRAWSSSALLWAHEARRLLTPRPDGAEWTEILLGFVAVHLAVRSAKLLRNGRQPFRPEPGAAAECPLSGADLEAVDRLYADVRDAILHHAERTTETGGGYGVDLSPTVRVRVYRGAGATGGNRSATAASALRTLDDLEPWLRRVWERVTLS